MTLTQKETTLLQDLISHEKLCIEKYSKSASEANDSNLQTIFAQIGQAEQQHLNTLNQISSGTIPNVSAGGSQGQSASVSMQGAQNSGANQQNNQNDKYLCSDLLSTEKHVSSLYDTCIFEFKDVSIRNALNHIQKEEQEHGQKISAYMQQNGMYA